MHSFRVKSDLMLLFCVGQQDVIEKNQDSSTSSTSSSVTQPKTSGDKFDATIFVVYVYRYADIFLLQYLCVASLFVKKLTKNVLSYDPQRKTSTK